MPRHKIISVGLLAALGLLQFGTAAALSSSTYSYNGGTFGLSGTAVSSSNCGGAANCYEVIYTANFAGFSSANQNYFSAIAFNPPGSTPTYLNLFATSGSAVGSWTTVTDNGLSNNGCASYSLTGQWVCDTTSPGLATTGSYEWDFYAALTTSNPDFAENSSIKMLFTTGPTGGNAGLLSCTAGECGTTAVPEPATLGLLGLGMAGIGFMRRRRRA